jgi:putative spermidine/putrescine transport system substrate-binding protein
LPTSPDNLKGMILPSPKWWKDNRQKVTERFNAWIIG